MATYVQFFLINKFGSPVKVVSHLGFMEFDQRIPREYYDEQCRHRGFDHWRLVHVTDATDSTRIA